MKSKQKKNLTFFIFGHQKVKFSEIFGNFRTRKFAKNSLSPRDNFQRPDRFPTKSMGTEEKKIFFPKNRWKWVYNIQKIEAKKKNDFFSFETVFSSIFFWDCFFLDFGPPGWGMAIWCWCTMKISDRFFHLLVTLTK